MIASAVLVVLSSIGLASAVAAPAVAIDSSSSVHPQADSAAVMARLEGVLNAECPLPGVATGGQPAAEHLRALAALGYQSVLDLRTAEESRGFDEDSVMRVVGLRYVKLPVAHGTLADSTIIAFRSTMQGMVAGKVFVHCASGNRVGAVMIPWLVLDQGWNLERAVATARAGGLRSPQLERAARDYVARMRRKG